VFQNEGFLLFASLTNLNSDGKRDAITTFHQEVDGPAGPPPNLVENCSKITKLYKQNENNGIDQSISPVAVVVTCIPVQK